MKLFNYISINRFFASLFFILFLNSSSLTFAQSFSQSPEKVKRVKSTLLPEIATISENIGYKTGKKEIPWLWIFTLRKISQANFRY